MEQDSGYGAKILEVKQTEIHEKASQSIKSKGWLPNLFRGIVAKAKDFLQKAFSVILVATVVVWFLQSFNLRLNMVSDSSDSMLAMIAQIFVPILTPLGLGDWRIATALISGVMAKESVVSTLSILYGSTQSLLMSLTTPAALSLLIFCLLYTPCIAAIAAIKRELGSKWAVSMVIWQCIVAWVAAFAIYLIGGLF